MLRVTQIAGFIGVALAGAAYVPQIWHLVRVHCSAGISRLAFGVWLGASLLVTAHAVATGSAVFIGLGGVQVVATALIVFYATRYKLSSCAGHDRVALLTEGAPGIPNEVLAVEGARPGPSVMGDDGSLVRRTEGVVG